MRWLSSGRSCAADGHRLLEQRDRALAQSLAAVGEADALQQLRPHLGLQI